MVENQPAPDPVHVDPLAPSLSEARDRSLNEDLHQLALEARVYAEAEFAFQKARAAYVAGAAKSVVVSIVLAAVLAFFAVMALVVGLVIALAPILTAWGSMAVVTLALLGLAIVLLLRAKKRIGRLMAVAGGES